MATNNLASNSKTVRVYGSRYRKIPNFNNYAVSASGTVINLTTRCIIMPIDVDQWSGRYDLYRNGKRTRVNAEQLVRTTWGDRQVTRMRNDYEEMMASIS